MSTRNARSKSKSARSTPSGVRPRPKGKVPARPSPRLAGLADEDSRAKLLRASEELFGVHGFDGVTVRDIAAAAGVNLSLVSYHFGGKDGVYRQVVASSLLNRIQFAEKTMKVPGTKAEFRLVFEALIRDMISFGLNHRHALSILMREAEEGFPRVRAEFETHMMALMTHAENFFRQASQRGFVRGDLAPHTIMMVLHGSVTHAVRCEGIQKEYFSCTLEDPKHREEFIQQILRMFLDGILT